LWTAPQGGEQGLGCWIDSLAGVLNLKLDRAPISERGVEPTFVVDLVDEVRKRMIVRMKRGHRTIKRFSSRASMHKHRSGRS
jgi:hypothetical protein